MIKIRPYVIVLAALLLAAGPWLQTAEVSGFPDGLYCDCCQGPCQGCCCAVEAPPVGEDSGMADDSCRCDISGLPAVPDVPIEFHEYRVDNKTSEIEPVTGGPGELAGDAQGRAQAAGQSPPPILSRPAYVLFRALLI